jgi:hypothetical protein
MTIDELAEAAAARGFHTVAVTDHSASSGLAGGLSPDRLLGHVDAVREAAARWDKTIAILAGSEVDIHPDVRLDYDDELLAKLAAAGPPDRDAAPGRRGEPPARARPGPPDRAHAQPARGAQP